MHKLVLGVALLVGLNFGAAVAQDEEVRLESDCIESFYVLPGYYAGGMVSREMIYTSPDLSSETLPPDTITDEIKTGEIMHRIVTDDYWQIVYVTVGEEEYVMFIPILPCAEGVATAEPTEE